MRGRPPSIREEDLLDAARDVFREDGHAATTAKIARRAGVSEGILFYRYKSKEALLAAVIHRETQPPEALAVIAKNAGQRSVGENLERLIEAVLDSCFRVHPFLELAETSPMSGAIRQLLFAEPETLPPQLIVEKINACFAAEMRLGRVRRFDTWPLARAIFGGCVDFVRSRQMPNVTDSRESFVRGFVDALMHGIANPPNRDDDHETQTSARNRTRRAPHRGKPR
ncbi:MAG: TetR/AcrR family transcriptional regulator [Deltaproteobacteria bacterium]|nr:TetR/AcrR family transcriptional regulator [Deltaproteobacteria bacterium]